jgi:hypothetical protein
MKREYAMLACYVGDVSMTYDVFHEYSYPLVCFYVYRFQEIAAWKAELKFTLSPHFYRESL